MLQDFGYYIWGEQSGEIHGYNINRGVRPVISISLENLSKYLDS